MITHYYLFIKIFLAAMAFSSFSCSRTPSAEEKVAASISNEKAEKDLEVIAYYTGETGAIDNETVKQLDQIIYSFLHLDGNKLNMNDARDSVSIAYLVSLKEAHPDLKILLSLGGWGGCETCSEVFSTEEGRREFAKSVKDALESHNSDGIDLDWEYPVVEGYPGHPFKPADRENFTALVEELRETLGDRYYISFAAGGFNEFLRESIEWEKVMPLLDKVNLMTYDLVNGNSITTGHHTPLYSTKEQLLSADNAIQFLNALGVPSEKMVIGSAFYARVWEAVGNTSNGLYQPGKFKEAVLYKDLDAFMEANSGFVTYWDSTAQAAYSYNSQKDLFATYDDSLSIARKTSYAIENDLGGIMFWQLSGDKAENGLIDVIDRVKSQGKP